MNGIISYYFLLQLFFHMREYIMKKRCISAASETYTIKQGEKSINLAYNIDTYLLDKYRYYRDMKRKSRQ